jgi:hypothetical protein
MDCGFPRPNRKSLIAISSAPAFNRRHKTSPDCCTHFRYLVGDLGWRPLLLGRAQGHNLIGVVSDQFQIDDRVKSRCNETGIARKRRLQRDEIQALVVNEPMLMIGLRFEFARTKGPERGSATALIASPRREIVVSPIWMRSCRTDSSSLT